MVNAQQQTDPTLPIPAPMTPENVTDESFVAKWQAIPTELNAVAEDGGYEVWTFVNFKAKSETDYDYVNTDFSVYKAGSPDNHGSGNFSYGTLTSINRYGWMGYNYYSVNSALALDNTSYGVMNGILMSPVLDFSKDNGNIKVEMTLCGREGVSYATITLFKDFTELGHVNMPVSEEWETQTVTLPGGMKDTYILIEMDGNNQGHLFIDKLRVYQTLQPGESAEIPYSWSYTNEPTQDDMEVYTDELTFRGECYGYRMTSFGITEYSQENYGPGYSGRSFYSPMMYVNAPDGIETTTVDKRGETKPYWLTPNIFVQNSKKYLKK